MVSRLTREWKSKGNSYVAKQDIGKCQANGACRTKHGTKQKVQTLSDHIFILTFLWLAIFGQWAVHRYWLIFMVVDRTFMEHKQNKPNLSTRHYLFLKNLVRKFLNWKRFTKWNQEKKEQWFVGSVSFI